MESDRVEMSVGGGTINGDHVANGVTLNGVVTASKKPTGESQGGGQNGNALTNGAGSKEGSGNVDAPLPEASEDILRMISTDAYLPMARLIGRSAQQCWIDLRKLVDRLAQMPVFAQNGQLNDQSKANLDKKDMILNFANDHKAVFIKLMVLLQWSKRGEEVRKTIELNYWLNLRRSAFHDLTFRLGGMIQDLARAQVPNPDLPTATEVLALGKVAHLPDLDYLPQQPLSPKQLLRTLKRLDHILCARLALDTTIPLQLHKFRVHDGRVTFSVSNEFELDLSLIDESPHAHFLMVDLRFLFSPAPSIPEAMHDEIAFTTNTAIEKDGLLGAYNFVHNLTLSYKINELHKQARELAQGLWSGCLRVEMIRRTLIVQYWVKRPGARSWLEIGIHSGRTMQQTQYQTLSTPQLFLRWMRDGKRVEEHSISMSVSETSLEKVLCQAIAQHSTSIFDSIYDKLSLSPLYVNAELDISQASSLEEPGECKLEIQLSEADQLYATIEPVTGAVVLGPVSDRMTRAQNELSRSKNLIEDFVARILRLRCAIAESNLLRVIVNSDWQYLAGFKLTHVETEGLFGQSVYKANFFRQQHWSPQWMLAFTTSFTGDHWWLTQRLKDSSSWDSRLTEVLRSRPLHMESTLSLTYLARLSDWTSGVISLQSNAQYLQKQQVPHKMARIPDLTRESSLPPLRFLHTSHPASITNDHHDLQTGRHQPEAQLVVHLRYGGVDPDSQHVITLARAQLFADSKVLAELARTQLDASVSISPATRQVMVKCTSTPGQIVIEDIRSKLKHLDNIVACAATVNRSSHHVLTSLSLSSLTILYSTEASEKYQLVINLASASHRLEVDFQPSSSNPHQYIRSYVAKMLTRRGQSLSKNLEEVLALLRMTQPMISYLHHLQAKHNVDTNGEQMTEDNVSDLIHVHVLPRQAATYGIHYFATTENFVRDVTDQETPKKLLARLEILPMKRGQHNLWMVRPAIEEFSTYIRPSYTSNALRAKLKEDIFAKRGATDWLPLGDGAACNPDKPEELLSALHDSIVKWFEEAVRSAGQPGQAIKTPNGASHQDNPPVSKPLPQPRVPQAPRSQNNPARPNGVQMPNQRSGQSYVNSRAQAPRPKQEVIQLD